MGKRGVFITLEGIDGTGKSTQALLLKDYLMEQGLDPILLREPGGTRVSEAIREILLRPDYTEMAARAELLLYEAARAQLVEERIKPALERGQAVVCERFTDSTLAYQGYGLGQEKTAVMALNQAASGGLEPNLTILFDLEPEVALKRAGGEDRIESRDLAYYRRVREGFWALAAGAPGRIKVIPVAGMPLEGVWELLQREVNGLLAKGRPSGKGEES